MKTEKRSELIDFLKQLKKLSLAKEFCANKDGVYEWSYDPSHLSQLLTGKRKGNIHFNKAIVADIKEFLKKREESI